MKRLDLIERKLGAIQDKDLEMIVAKNIFIPFIGRPEKTEEVAAWLKIRSDALEQAKILPKQAIRALITKQRKALSKESRDIIDGKDIKPNPDEFDAICGIRLLKFSLGDYE